MSLTLSLHANANNHVENLIERRPCCGWWN
nr:MAG TPA: hypothetical protein [Caudoviricetes sp.]